jgi:YD repeat-containing protein
MSLVGGRAISQGKPARQSTGFDANSTAWGHCLRGRVISETQTIAATAYTTLSSYDAADRLRTLTYPTGEVVTTTYNSQGLAASLVGTNVYVQDSRYDAAGRVISRTLGSGAVQWQTQYSYYPWTTANGQGRPWLPHQGRLHILQSGPLTNTTLLQNLTYTYDAVGNVKTIVDGVNSNQKQCFQYDPLGRLTRATISADPVQLCTTPAGAGNYSEGYDYPGQPTRAGYKGGSLKRKGAADNANDGLYTYGDLNRPHAVTGYRGNSYSYPGHPTRAGDVVGNMITRTVSGVTYTLTYNAENRLTQVVSGTLTASYVYDGDGNRVRSVITAGGLVTETHYVGAHYEKTVDSGDTKYYYIAGQLVAFERSSGYGVDWGRRFLFRDHPSKPLRARHFRSAWHVGRESVSSGLLEYCRPSVLQQVLGDDLAPRARLPAQRHRVGGGMVAGIAHALEQRAIADAGGGEEDLAAGDQLVRRENPLRVEPGGRDRLFLDLALRVQPAQHGAARGANGAGGHQPLGDAARTHQQIHAAARRDRQQRAEDVSFGAEQHVRARRANFSDQVVMAGPVQHVDHQIAHRLLFDPRGQGQGPGGRRVQAFWGKRQGQVCAHHDLVHVDRGRGRPHGPARRDGRHADRRAVALGQQPAAVNRIHHQVNRRPIPRPNGLSGPKAVFWPGRAAFADDDPAVHLDVGQQAKHGGIGGLVRGRGLIHPHPPARAKRGRLGRADQVKGEIAR